jgi:hypothetical protein
MRRFAICAFLLGSLIGPVHAQQEDKSDNPLLLEEERRKKDFIDVDKQYKSTLQRTRQETKTAPHDPWSNMRGADDSKTKR